MSDTRKRLVVALGGNAISAPGKVGDIDEQFAQVSETAEVLCDAIERGYHLIVTHGNGPQVGNILRRVELARGELYPIPLEVCVADTQAGMGYMIAQCLSNTMNRRNLTCDVTAVVTTVLVDPNDPAFQDPNKAIGPDAHSRPSRDASHERRLANPRRRQRPLPSRGAVARSRARSSRCRRLIRPDHLIKRHVGRLAARRALESPRKARLKPLMRNDYCRQSRECRGWATGRARARRRLRAWPAWRRTGTSRGSRRRSSAARPRTVGHGRRSLRDT